MSAENPSPSPATQPLAPASTEAASSAPAAPAAPAATDGAAQADPRKGLPPIAKPTVIRAEGGPPPRGPRGPGGPGGGGGRGFGRGPRGDSGPRPEVVPNTKQTLLSVTDEAASGLTADMSSQIDQAMASAQAPTPAKPRPVIKPMEPARVRGPRKVEAAREIRPGRVVSIGPSDVFLEFGPKELAIIPRTQWKAAGADGTGGEELPTVGATLEVVVDKFDTSENLFHCSRPGAIQKAAWETLTIGQTIEARVSGVASKDNKQVGLQLEVAGHSAFMPASQISLDHVPDLSVYIGEKLVCQVARIETAGKGNIVLSRRDLLKQEREERAKKLKETLQEGQTVEGTVRKLMPFGAFVDIGGLDGLVHLSDLTYDRVHPGEKNVEKFVKVGDKVKVKILKLDMESNKISLGLKQTASDPFVTATNALTEGADVTGRIVRLAEFGAFVEIAPGVDALLHVSEISRKRINNPGDVLKQDQVIQARIIKLEKDSRRISLSMKVLEKVEAPAPGSREARFAEKQAEKKKRDEERLAELSKESPELRRQRAKFRGKELSGGFGEKAKFLGGGLGDLKLG